MDVHNGQEAVLIQIWSKAKIQACTHGKHVCCLEREGHVRAGQGRSVWKLDDIGRRGRRSTQLVWGRSSMAQPAHEMHGACQSAGGVSSRGNER